MWTIENAEECARRRPNTTIIPAPDRREALVVGDVVSVIFTLNKKKLGFVSEWILVEVTQVGDNAYEGALLSDSPMRELRQGHTVAFLPMHVADVSSHVARVERNHPMSSGQLSLF